MRRGSRESSEASDRGRVSNRTCGRPERSSVNTLAAVCCTFVDCGVQNPLFPFRPDNTQRASAIATSQVTNHKLRISEEEKKKLHHVEPFWHKVESTVFLDSSSTSTQYKFTNTLVRQARERRYPIYPHSAWKLDCPSAFGNGLVGVSNGAHGLNKARVFVHRGLQATKRLVSQVARMERCHQSLVNRCRS